jgi:EAL domain-containing protein (putative c-di-GMP-specific phosphodiesterase class I)
MEVTESALLSNTDTTVGTLKRIRGMGVRLAIDDFGAGYSSLTYLTLCDFDVLKIDRAFITGMVGRGEGTAITRAILAMAAILDLRVVAEGVENDLQAARLIEMGCTLAQGDLYSRPVDLERLARLLAHDGGGLPGAETREGSPPGGRMAS